MHDNNTPRSLEDLVFPLSQNKFFQSYWGKTFMHLTGAPEKLTGIFPWQHLNTVLSQFRLTPPRMRLVKEGAPVKAATYLEMLDGRPRCVKAPAFTRELADGATLIIDEAEELHAPLRELVVSLERTFRIPIQANLYAGWRKNQGFNLHWDTHDVLVLQVAGRKLWKVYEPTCEYPLRDNYETAARPDKLVWEGVLCAGEIIYMPRGWWHVACPLDEPCLHVTIGLRNRTGIDLVRWFTESLENLSVLRQDLPHWADAGERAAHCEKLKQAIATAWTSTLMDRFFEEKDIKASPRGYFSLPNSASPQTVLLPPHAMVRLVVPRKLEFVRDARHGVVRFKSCGREWQCTDLLLPLLQALNENQGPVPVSHMPAISEEIFEVRQSLQDFISQGLLVVEDHGQGAARFSSNVLPTSIKATAACDEAAIA
jgi:ribosomal protein L16 Arg81 hydroxylase